MTTATTRSITAALKREGLPLEFVSTRAGYQYFVFDQGDDYATRSVYVNSVSDLTITQWLEDARTFLNDLKGA